MPRWVRIAGQVLWWLFVVAVVSLALYGSIVVREPDGPKLTFDQEFPLRPKASKR